MKVCITGANGFLGQYLVTELLERGMEVIATGQGNDRSGRMPQARYQYLQLDITEIEKYKALLAANRPDFLVHLAAITQPDACALDPARCTLINEKATADLAGIADTYRCHFVLLSTDFVFDGKKGNYTEQDVPAPISHYGHTKLAAEHWVKASSSPWTIIRTCLVYGNAWKGTRANILSWVKESLEKGEPIKVVNDQVRTPTYVADLAQAIGLMLAKRATGIFHISGKDVRTPYQMAIETARWLGYKQELITPVTAATFSQPAQRPLLTGLDCTRAIRELGYKARSFEEGLRAMFERPTAS